jgi:hypothetical protein
VFAGAAAGVRAPQPTNATSNNAGSPMISHNARKLIWCGDGLAKFQTALASG